MITFYDLAKKGPQTTWSPNPLKIRFALNYKKIPYKTVVLEYQELEAEFKKVGIPPSDTWGDGRPMYTSPSIFDSSTNTGVTDSYKIAQYLDKAYPDTPKLFPPGTEALQAAFYAQFYEVIAPFYPFAFPKVPGILNPSSAEYFYRTRSLVFGDLASFEPQGEKRAEAWKNVEAAYTKLDGWLSQSSGPYIMGETVTFVDFAVLAMIYATELVLGKDSKEFTDLMKWNNGRWAEYRKSLEQYA
ncbi:hypothetical protein AGABI1DRAFT_80492 [Agaricus bisporus var. burnettii JB137-S8]|uniref:GST N-terminal domain-containing protein n=2 Tax=Agaricus bisporus var. burnettii TaxID=192524 RepID=K5XKD0_AGABU|nr:uncharacterized protein AGABI1DRAFT_80492 [Agaricus bisporus var. burnettii JB137-S8]EKM74965.1 hypothetical protein AGABI1DRAFT_80492 [Agaricus bisporus var. burnettii JB137-S8]KAF7782153.1 hypothetical protein Agabi119p4_1529 [Agaricus bisporus var. burnettii]